MSQVADMFLWGTALGTAMGGVLGYATHACVAWARKHKDEVQAVNTYKPYHPKVAKQPPTEAVMPRETERRQRIPVLKVVESPHHPDRDTVVSALTSSGFKKAQAVQAADACSAPEKSTVESWTVAALRRAGSR